MLSYAFLALLAVLPTPRPEVMHAAARSQVGCAAALAAEGSAFDGYPKDTYTWGGETQELEPIDGLPVTACVAGGPITLLPASNRIGCVLVGDEVARVDDNLACGAFRNFAREGDGDLLWFAHTSAISAAVTRLQWNGAQLAVVESFTECWDGSRVGLFEECPSP